jgi:outer membrane protein, heavy metal efflux system
VIIARAGWCMVTVGALILGLAGCASPRERWQAPAAGLPDNLPTRPATAPLPPHPSLADLQAYALANNPQVTAAWQDWRAALQGPEQASALMDPMVGAGARIKQTEGPDMQEQFLMASQQLPWPGKRSLRRQVASHTADMAWQKLEDTKRQVLMELTQVHAEAIYLARAIVVAKEALQIMSDVEQLVRARYSLGKAMAGELSKMQLELANMEGEVEAMKLMEPPLLARLNALLNRSPETPW